MPGSPVGLEMTVLQHNLVLLLMETLLGSSSMATLLDELERALISNGMGIEPASHLVDTLRRWYLSAGNRARFE